MKTPSAVLIGILASAAASGVIAFVAFGLLRDTNAEVRRLEALSEIVDKTRTLHILTASDEEGAVQADLRQIREILQSLDDLLKSLSPRVRREEALIEQLRLSHQELGPLIDLWFASGRAPDGLERARRALFASQIWMKAQVISGDTKRLKDISESRIFAAQHQTALTIVALIVLLAVTNGVIYLLSVRTIVRSQRALLENQRWLRESREDLNRAQAVAHVGSWRLNVLRNELTWSDESYRIAGIPKGTPLTYESFLAIVHPEDREYVDRKWKAALKGEPFDIEHRIVVNSEIRWARSQTQLEFDAQGRLLKGFGAFHDITERKRAEETLRENQQRLELALEAAQAADRAKDRFLATLSHELRTPLTPVVMTVATLLRTESLDADTRRRLEVIRRNVEAQAQMISDLLDLSRIIHDRLELRFGDVDAHQLLQRTLDICTAGGDDVKLQITVTLEARRHHVRGDEARLQQVFWNLIQNAFKFTPAGGKLVIRSTNDGGRLRLSVSDTGRGIEAPLLARIFEPFEQGDRQGRPSVQGLGLGLAIARRIVAAHGGSITAVSDGPGRGATFTVELDTISVPPDTSDRTLHEKSHPAPDDHPVGGRSR